MSSRAITSIITCLLLLAGVARSQRSQKTVVTVVDEVGAPVAGAQIVVHRTESPTSTTQTDFAGRAGYLVSAGSPYQIQVNKPGFYQRIVDLQDPEARELRIVLNHEQVVSTNV